MAGLSSALRRQLVSVVGRDNYCDTPEELYCYGFDATPGVSHLPDALVMPGTAEEVAKVVRLAADAEIPIVPRGSGTNLSGGAVPARGGIVLGTLRLAQIHEIDAVNLTAVAAAGVITGTLRGAAEKQGLYYPPDPGSLTVSTLGGNIAEGASGPSALKYGGTRDYVMGLEVVLASGEVVRLGSKNVKDVAGYDLVRLTVGSEGTLGIVTEVTLRLIPLPPARCTALAVFDSLAHAAQAVTAIIAERIVPASLEILDQTTIRCVEDYAHVGLPREAQALLLVVVDGNAEAARAQLDSVEQVCAKAGATQVKAAESEEEGENLAAARRAALSALARVRPTTVLEDVTVPRTHLVEMLEQIQAIAARHRVTIGTFGHAGDGNLHPTILTDERDAEEMKRVDAAIQDIFAAAIALGGTVTGEHGIGLAKARYLTMQHPPAVLTAMRAVKQALDPKGIMNPGKIFWSGG